MEDYYKILGLANNARSTDIINNYNLKLLEYKCLPFLTDKDKQNIKNIKKAFFILSNDEYKKTYDNSLKIQNKPTINAISNDFDSYSAWDNNSTLLQNNNTFEKQNLPNENKKQLFNHSYISDRIFSLNVSTVNTTNTTNNKLSNNSSNSSNSSNSNNIKIKY